MRTRRITGLLSAWIGLATTLAPGADENGADEKGVELFERRIRPVLIKRCYKCHSFAKGKAKGKLRVDTREAIRRGGESGPAVVPGDPSKSRLLDALSHGGDFFDMPPDGKLPDEVIADFRRWIEIGAPDPRLRTAGALPASATRKRRPDDLWSLKPRVAYEPPRVEDAAWPLGAIDRFLLARLESTGLRPAPDADRPTWLRRVRVDLSGLPPSAREIDDFASDDSKGAHRKVVDRLLASPAFGERWARHWFDLSCFADLGDVDGNMVIRDAWRYRDYVIAAFDLDKPLDRFIREQIAGDLLPHDSAAQRREQIIATGFLAIGPWTLQNYIKGQLRADVVDHQIDKIGRSFLGMTLACARCHDHKFDPIPTRDYYAMAGIFHSTLTTRHDGPGVWSRIMSTALPENPAERALRENPGSAYRKTVDEIADIERRRRDLLAEKSSLRARTAEEADGQRRPGPRPGSVNTLTLRDEIAANDKGTMYRVRFDALPSVWSAPGQATAEGDGLAIEILRADGSLLAAHVHRPGAWSVVANRRAPKGASFGYVGDGSGGVRILIAADPPVSGRFGGAIDNLVVEAEGRGVFAETFDDYSTGAGAGAQAHTGLRVRASGTFRRWRGGGINHSHAVELAEGNFAPQLFGGNPGDKGAGGRAGEIDRELGKLAARRVHLDYHAPRPPRALAVRDVETPGDARIHVRGNFQTLGDRVPRGVLSTVNTGHPRPVSNGESGRRELAEWIVDPVNPLTARVLVNRLWHHVFGRGLVASVDYFGVHGDRPSHPELLDWLASRLVEDGWSVKRLLREMVLSRAYRMSSAHDARGLEIDPDNRLLWRMRRRRLGAEAIRDSLLAVSGRLSRARGGPSLGLNIPGNVNGIGGDVNPPTYGGSKVPAGLLDRRSVYQRLWRRPPDGDLEILSVFDFPHPNEITGARATTTVATQALFLLNSATVKDAAARTAARYLAMAGLDDEARFRQLHIEVFGRRPGTAEVSEALGFLETCERASVAAGASPSDGRETAWRECCHAVLISNRFLFRE